MGEEKKKPCSLEGLFVEEFLKNKEEVKTLSDELNIQKAALSRATKELRYLKGIVAKYVGEIDVDEEGWPTSTISFYLHCDDYDKRHNLERKEAVDYLLTFLHKSKEDEAGDEEKKEE